MCVCVCERERERGSSKQKCCPVLTSHELLTVGVACKSKVVILYNKNNKKIIGNLRNAFSRLKAL